MRPLEGTGTCLSKGVDLPKHPPSQIKKILLLGIGKKEILLPLARHLEERPAVRQSVRQAVSRASRQGDR